MAAAAAAAVAGAAAQFDILGNSLSILVCSISRCALYIYVHKVE